MPVPKHAITPRFAIFAREQRRFHIVAAVIALYLAAVFTLDETISFTGLENSPFPANWPTGLSARQCAGFIPLAALLWALLVACGQAVSRLPKSKRGQRPTADTLPAYMRSHVKVALACFSAVLLPWLVVFASFYPGASMNDQVGMIGSPAANTDVHPALYAYPVSWSVELSYELLGDGSVGFALFVCAQMALCALMVMACIMWLRYRGAPRWARALVLAFFALTPIVSDYAVTNIKDTLFSFSLLLLVPIMCEFAFQGDAFWKRRHHIPLFVAACSLVGITRGNGLYLVGVLVIIVFAVSLRRPAVRNCLFACMLSVAIPLAPSLIAPHLTGVTPWFTESLSVPLQQLAAVQCVDEANLSDEEITFLDLVFVPNAARKSYAPAFADPMKFDNSINRPYIQENRFTFLRDWFTIGLKNPQIYAKAWLAQTYGIWDPLSKNYSQSTFFALAGNDPDSPVCRDIMSRYNLANHSLYPEPLASAFASAYRNLVRCPSNGALFALMLFLCYLAACRHRDLRLLAIGLPGFLLWGTLMLSAPISVALRYGFFFLLSLPVLAGIISLPRGKPPKHGRVTATRDSTIR